MSRSLQFLHGMRDGIPILFGYIPVSIAFAIAARSAGFTALETQLMSITVFTGASQMMAVGMWAEAATIAAITVASLIVNLRYIIMSTCIMQRMRGGSLGFRSLLAFGVTDESFAVFTSAEEERCTPLYYAGIALVGYLSWNAGTFIGALGADFLPMAVTAAFGIALHAMFTCIVAPNLRGNYRLALVVLLAAVTNSLLSFAGFGTWSMVIATLLSAFVGVFFVELDDDGSEKSGGEAPPCENSARKDDLDQGDGSPQSFVDGSAGLEDGGSCVACESRRNGYACGSGDGSASLETTASGGDGNGSSLNSSDSSTCYTVGTSGGGRND